MIWASGDHCDTVTGGSRGEVVRGQSLEKCVGSSRMVDSTSSKGPIKESGDEGVACEKFLGGVGRVKECFLLGWGKPYPVG